MSGLTSAGPGGNATIQNGNPAATFQAVFPTPEFDTATGTTISGSVVATTPTNGTGVMFSINLANLPSPALYGPLGAYNSFPLVVKGFSGASDIADSIFRCSVPHPSIARSFGR